MRLCLIGCSKTKTRNASGTPGELYAGDLFRKRVDYARRNQLPWFVLSAKYGLLLPDQSLPNYDTAPADFTKEQRSTWAGNVAFKLAQFGDYTTVEIHAGNLYADPLSSLLRAAGLVVERPCQGLGIGQQLKCYKDLERAAERTCAF